MTQGAMDAPIKSEHDKKSVHDKTIWQDAHGKSVAHAKTNSVILGLDPRIHLRCLLAAALITEKNQTVTRVACSHSLEHTLTHQPNHEHL